MRFPQMSQVYCANTERLEGEIGIANRIKRSEDTFENNKNKTEGNVKRKTPKGKKPNPPPKRHISVESSSLSSSQQQSSCLFTSS